MNRNRAVSLSAGLHDILHSKRWQTVQGNKADNSHNNVVPEHERDPYTGQVKGLRISACRACGHSKIVSAVTGLCGTQTCIKRRRRKYAERRKQRAEAAARTKAEA